MKITVKGNSNERLKVTSDERREDVEPVLQEIRKMSRKLRHLLKNGYEIDLTISSENSPLEEQQNRSYLLHYWKNHEHSQEQRFRNPVRRLLHQDQERKVKHIQNLRLEQTLNSQEVLKYYKQTQAHPLSIAIISRKQGKHHRKENEPCIRI